jgi:uncharacterized protein (TIGR02453 family)
MAANLKTILDFLGRLKRNNNRPWFEKHREEYEEAKAGFELFITGLIHGIDEFDGRLAGVTAKDSVMRIYRDVRFSKDKSPYKTNFAAHIGPGGRKSQALGYYLHLSPGDTLLGGGLYMPEPKQLAAFRAGLARNPSPFKKIITGKEFKKQFGKIEGESLVKAPKGFDPDHPEIDLLKLKQILASRTFPDKEVLSPAFPKQVLAAAKALKPFLDYLNGALGIDP